MRRRPSPTVSGRPGYTLLEVILTAAITALLMAGLYVALRVQYDQADAGRAIVEQSTLAQNLIQRITDDVNQELGPLLPTKANSNSNSNSGGNSNSNSGSGGGGTGTGSNPNSNSPNPTSDGSTGASTSNSGTSGNSSTTDGSTTATADLSGGPVTFNLGVQGSSSQLTLYVSRVPRELNGNDAPVLSDLRRITYWMGSGGLARQEVKQATSQDATVNMPPNVDASTYQIIGERVKSVTFSYWDGTSWQDSWDGTTLGGPNGNVPTGPPMAIRIELQIAPSGPGADDSKNWKTYRQTVAIVTANRLTQQQQQQNGQ
jgi:type II secretory pathway pseudopilin PulG